VLELVPRVVLLGAAAQDFDDQSRVRHRLRVPFMALAWPTNHGDIRISRQSGRCADAEVGIVGAVSTATKLREEQTDDGGRERSVLRRTVCPRIDLAVEILMLDVTRSLKCQVLAIRVMDLVEGRRHLS